MSRYNLRPPFSALASFVAVRAFVFNGEDVQPGDPVPFDASLAGVMRKLYDQRRIDMAPTDETVEQAPKRKAARAPKAAKAAKAAPVAAPVAETAAPATVAPETEEAAPVAAPVAETADLDIGSFSVKQAGLGGFKVINPEGAPVGPGFKTFALARAEAARLHALSETPV